MSVSQTQHTTPINAPADQVINRMFEALRFQDILGLQVVVSVGVVRVVHAPVFVGGMIHLISSEILIIQNLSQLFLSSRLRLASDVWSAQGVSRDLG